VNRLCASGLNAVNQAARAIAVGEGDVYIAGGVESMSRAPYSFPKNSRAWGPPGNITGYDTTLGWRYPNPKMEALFPLEAMGETAENIYDMSWAGRSPAAKSRGRIKTAFALESQRRACEAVNNGRFHSQIVPVPIPQKKGTVHVRHR
jgi:acetyl-CoA acetyltransferase